MTHCPFANVDRVDSFFDDGALPQWCRKLDEFLRESATRDPDLDGVIATMPAPEYIASPAQLGELLRMILETVGDDPLGDPDSSAWWFRYLSEDWLVLAFSHIYASDHPRTTGGDPYLHLLFQRERAFDQFRTANGRIAPSTRARVRARFAAHGQPYSEVIAEHPLEAAKFILPVDAHGPVVRWWR